MNVPRTMLIRPRTAADLRQLKTARAGGGHVLLDEDTAQSVGIDVLAGAAPRVWTVQVLGDRVLATEIGNRIPDVPVFVAASAQVASETARQWELDHFADLDAAVNADDVWFAYGSGAPS